MLRFWVVLALVCLAAGASADAKRLPGKRLSTVPTIDGTVNPAEWTEAAYVDGLVTEADNRPESERSEFWLGYDANFIYWAARLTDSQPNRIRATQYRTNVGLDGDDSVGLYVDMGGKLSDFESFQINPRGATSLGLLGGRANKREWTGEFLAKARRTPTGWECEARIPWKLLTISRFGLRSDIRFNFGRFNPRLGQGYTWGYYGGGRSEDTPYWENVEVPVVKQDRSIKLLPYVYAGWDEDEGGIFNSGLDAKMDLTSDFSLVGSINPDFRNIENQILSLDYSRFARIAGESRPFFLEGGDTIGTAIFASQLIPQFDIGVKGYGKLGNNINFGALNVSRFGKSNAFVGTMDYRPTSRHRYRLSLTRSDDERGGSTAYLARIGQQFGPWDVTFRTMGSENPDRPFGMSHNLEFEYYSSPVYSFVNLTQTDREYAPSLGFVPQTGYRSAYTGYFVNRDWGKGPLRSQGFGVSGGASVETTGRDRSKSVSLNSYIAFRNDLSFSVGGDYDEFQGEVNRFVNLGFGVNGSDRYRSQGIGATFGTIGGRDYRNLSLNSNWRPLNGFQINGSYQRVTLGDTRDQAIIGMSYDLTPDLTLGSRIVVRDGKTNPYVSIQKSGNRGTEFFLIVGDPNADSFRTSIILKVVTPIDTSKW